MSGCKSSVRTGNTMFSFGKWINLLDMYYTSLGVLTLLSFSLSSSATAGMIFSVMEPCDWDWSKTTEQQHHALHPQWSYSIWTSMMLCGKACLLYQDLTNFIWPFMGYQVSIDLSKLIPYMHQTWKHMTQHTPSKQGNWKWPFKNKENKEKFQYMK